MHTPEPWKIDAEDEYAFVSEEWGGIGLVHNEPAENEPLMAMARATADRIVACVNACKGINPEAVPEMHEALVVAEDFLNNPPDNEEKYNVVARRVVQMITAALTKAEKTNG